VTFKQPVTHSSEVHGLCPVVLAKAAVCVGSLNAALWVLNALSYHVSFGSLLLNQGCLAMG
jgi:hypothetical protein